MRYHYMDNLRALAMMLGIFYHAALAYSPFMDELWLTADPGKLVFLDVVVWFLHLFRMPLFFLISGFFAHHMVIRFGVSGYLKNRFFRIVLPFLVFLPLTLVATLAVVFYTSRFLGVHTVLLDYVISAISNLNQNEAYFSTSHLWFLYNLIYFCGLAGFFYHYLPHGFSEKRIFSSPLFLLVILPLILVPSLLGRITPLPIPGRLMPELWSFGYFGVFFFLGWLYYKNECWLSKLTGYWLPMTLVCGIAYLGYYRLIPSHANLQQTLYQVVNAKELSVQGLVGAIAAAFVSVYGTLICLLLGSRYLNRENRVLRYFADSSYWVYIIHLPLLFFIQMHLLKLEWSLWLKFGVGSLGTVAIGLLTYAMFVRKTSIGWMLNGRKYI